ncbi:hypothetical protein KC19_VG328300 [Ceratodon purpureus]|uniref:Uncharacterized protein n=1 Tax=Ceratodon purpureus TaxID=3225 RepID=A0A8T0HW02_CERPU|nr:hypothetical protein KC19_VG328300 [Ceratodon purpureus]
MCYQIGATVGHLQISIFIGHLDDKVLSRHLALGLSIGNDMHICDILHDQPIQLELQLLHSRRQIGVLFLCCTETLAGRHFSNHLGIVKWPDSASLKPFSDVSFSHGLTERQRDPLCQYLLCCWLTFVGHGPHISAHSKRCFEWLENGDIKRLKCVRGVGGQGDHVKPHFLGLSHSI